MMRNNRWYTLYKGFLITQRHSDTYYANAYLYDTIQSASLSKLKQLIRNRLSTHSL